MKELFRKLRKYLLQLRRRHAIILMSIAVGISSGLIAVVLKNTAFGLRRLLTEGFAIDGVNWLFAIYPIIGIALTWLIIRKLLKGVHPGPGIPVTLHAISKRKGRLKRKQIYASVLTSVFTVGFGGSAGLEAPAVQSSAAAGSTLASTMRMSYQTRILMIACAAAGSLAAIFKAPVAAIIFAVEVIMIDLTTASLVPLLMSSLSALLTTTLLREEDQLLSIELAEPFTLKYLGLYILLGIICGLSSVYFNRIYLSITRRMQSFRSLWLRLSVGGVVMGGMLLLFPPLYGEGYDVLNAYLRDDLREVTLNSVFYEFSVDSWVLLGFLFALMVLKVVATGITLGAGGVGGIFAPTLFMGGTLGYLFAKLLDRGQFTAALPVGNFALLGMAGLMSGVLHAPLTSIFLIAEISGGYDLFVPLMLTAGIAYYTSRLSGKHTIYTRELAERGELITHNKDQAVLTLMNLRDEVENNFTKVMPEATLRDLVTAVSKSKRNLFPVVDADEKLLGIVLLDDIRPIMFNTDLYDEVRVHELMTLPPEVIQMNERMEKVVSKFDESGAWNLPVVNDSGKYLGFVSKSRLFSAYREVLMQVTSE